MRTIYNSYTYRLRQGHKALHDGTGSAEAKINRLENALERVMDEYGALLQTMEEDGYVFSHGLDGQISKVFKKSDSKQN